MNQIERIFKGCDFSFNLPHPDDISWRIRYSDVTSFGYITLMRVIDIPHLNKDRAKTAVRKLTRFANVLVDYVTRSSDFGLFDLLAICRWLENTDWYMVERG